jgi:hypothetical protein
MWRVGTKGRLNLLSEKVKNRMETFVERKVAEILADLE